MDNDNIELFNQLKELVEKHGNRWTLFSEALNESPEKLRSLWRRNNNNSPRLGDSGYISLPKEDADLVKEFMPDEAEIQSLYIGASKRFGVRYKKKVHTPQEVLDFLLSLDVPRRNKRTIYTAQTKQHDEAYEFFVPDAHFGKPVSGYNPSEYIRKAAAYFNNKVAGSHVIFPVGNDLLHVSGSNGKTRAGTQVGIFGDFLGVFEEAYTCIVEIIESFSVHSTVEVPIIQGNHDWDLVGIMGVVLSKQYENNDNVNILYDAHSPRKYVLFGNTLMGYTHGNSEPHTKLPGIMASEAQDYWGKSKYRYWHLGHVHHRTVKEYPGVIVETFPSISPNDGWHIEHGFVEQQRGIIISKISSKYGISESRTLSIGELDDLF